MVISKVFIIGGHSEKQKLTIMFIVIVLSENSFSVNNIYPIRFFFLFFLMIIFKWLESHLCDLDEPV